MMKLWKLSLAGLIMIGSCKREKGIDNVVVEADVNLYIIDAEGNNLLEDSELTDGLKLYYIVDGEEQEVYDQNMDAERNFTVLKFEGAGKYNGEPFIRVFANTIDQGDMTRTILKWSNSTVDTLTTEITRKGASLWVKNVWLNGNLVWTPEIGKEKYETGEITDLSNFIIVAK